ncbi:energy-coupling factor ABC transporter permease [Methanoculleus chikugoensis]|uniref:energy-coupling factor ABC transporter permease n=1 Tax=Methanoculleus chikugoensis TaxID=118126 RepID=UPI001FB50F95|nr:energy-coupling factor ABC transporter permease [Methanoculleus chikugoensis]
MGQALVYWVIALVFIALALRWARRSMGEEKIPLVAVLAAGIFAIQALNIPIPWGGTSGHMSVLRSRQSSSGRRLQGSSS